MRKHGAILDSAFLLSWKTQLGLRAMFTSLLWQRFRFNKARDEPEVVGPGCFVQTCTIISVWSSHSLQLCNPDAGIFDLA